MPRITEEQLILPSLYLMENSPSRTITTTHLKDGLVSIFKPTGEDASLASSRKDSLFTQKVRNLKSHNTLEMLGYATYNEKSPGTKSGSFTLTQAGKTYLAANMNVVSYLLNNDFGSEDLKAAFDTVYGHKDKAHLIETFDENTTINEGSSKIIMSKVYERSTQLRNAAIHYYTHNNRIKCHACCFDFEDFYGIYGRGFIEIHHQKPVFMFNGDDLNKTIDHALSNVIPLCPNCHRMVHRNKEHPLTLGEIKSHISKKLSFCS